MRFMQKCVIHAAQIVRNVTAQRTSS